MRIELRSCLCAGLLSSTPPQCASRGCATWQSAALWRSSAAAGLPRRSMLTWQQPSLPRACEDLSPHLKRDMH